MASRVILAEELQKTFMSAQEPSARNLELVVRLDCGLARLPARRANFAMLVSELRDKSDDDKDSSNFANLIGLDKSEHFIDIASDRRVVVREEAQHALGIDDEQPAQRVPVIHHHALASTQSSANT